HNNQQDARLKALETMTASAVKAAQSAAQTAIDIHASVNEMKKTWEHVITNIKNDQATHAGEILKLIINDADFKKQQDEILLSISKTAEGATQAITKRAINEGNNLSKRVSIPVTLITAIATIIQYLILKFG